MRLGSSNARKVLPSAASTSRWGTRTSPSAVKVKAMISVAEVMMGVPRGGRRALGEAEVAEVERALRQLPRHPREGDVLRPMAEHVEHQPDPVQAEVSRFEGGEQRGPAGRRLARRPSLYSVSDR